LQRHADRFADPGKEEEKVGHCTQGVFGGPEQHSDMWLTPGHRQFCKGTLLLQGTLLFGGPVQLPVKGGGNGHNAHELDWFDWFDTIMYRPSGLYFPASHAVQGPP
jgi:hypothetical protein